MKKIDQKDLPKLIGLIVLSLGVFGFAIMQFAGGTTASAGSPPPAATAEAGDKGGAAAKTAAAAATVSGADEASTFDITQIPISNIGKDPFVPNGPAAGMAPKMPPAPTPVPAPAPIADSGALPRKPEVPFDSGSIPGPGIPPRFKGPEPSGPGPGLAPALPVPPAEMPDPAYQVTGIVRGGTNIAVLRGTIDAAERRFVKAGDSLSNGFVVDVVRADAVELKSGSRRVTLKLGGSRAK